MFQQIKFESDRLIARPLERKDAESLFKIYSDQEAMKYRGSAPMQCLEEAFHMIVKQQIKDNHNTKIRLGLLDKSKDRLIGTLLLDIKKNQTNCEVGFSFGKKYWSNGFGSETLKMVEESLEKTKKIKEICAWCVKENIASVKIFQKAGYVKKQQIDYPQSYLFEKKIKNDTTTKPKLH